MINIDLNAIRPLNGKRAEGFEELCAQLARFDRPANSRFERKGTPDAGVECYAVLEDGSEWGWQSKYFDSFGPSQWQQLDESVETVLVKHPHLVRYVICIPLNRPDGRISGKQSAMEAWARHVSKWQGWAAGKGMQVEFIYWGESEILDQLARPAHLGRVRFWFDTQAFDQEWFTARLKEALQTAGARYTAELNLSLPIAEEYEAFGRTSKFFDGLKALAKDIREHFRRLYPNQEVLKNKPIGEAYTELAQLIQDILPNIGRIPEQPVGELLYAPLVEQLSSAIRLTKAIEELLLKKEFEPIPSAKQKKNRPTSTEPYQDLRNGIYRLNTSLRKARSSFQQATAIANTQLLIMTGQAGCGKTHLLCDIAAHRISEGRPTVLLMGQRFIGTNDPWMQALQQLDLATISVEEAIGALESAAQVADSRLLLLVDAINEGNGRSIWPNNIASFLTQATRSPWLGVVFSVRSSYEGYLVPADVRAQAHYVDHQGFTGLEYDATKSFFIHYGLELPSTPLLAPEFRNPLFLKTLCKGLKLKNQRRLPRGFHGITAAFNLYLDGVNEVLATRLDYHPRQNLVRKALEVFAEETAHTDERWLPLSAATSVVDKLLPGRSHTQSLYHGLVTEGVLTEEASRWTGESEHEEVVFISYERLADHLFTNVLLNQYLDATNPAESFKAGTPLAVLYDTTKRFHEGTVEALFIQVPERTGRELSELAPEVLTHWNGHAFRQSIIWRKTTAFSPATRQALRAFDETDGRLEQTLEAILTVASLPDHPFNAEFLDQRLREDGMAERDAWWSILLHDLWDTQSAVDRLVDWSWGVEVTTPLDPQAVELCSITLAWLFTSSNRFLRDRATKGLANLLTGRLEAACKLVERFGDVDDPYVVERVYAAAYGASMRSYDVAAVEQLAVRVFDCVFALQAPPVHILLRDYARGIIEWAIYLGATHAFDLARIRPPFNSSWPVIPTEAEVAQLFPDHAARRQDNDGSWALDRIRDSVMADDFGRYVIDPNLDDWLSVPLREPIWKQPKDQRQLLTELALTLSESEQEAWAVFQKAEAALKNAQQLQLQQLLAEQGDDDFAPFFSENSPELEKLQAQLDVLTSEEHQAYEAASQILEAAFTPEHMQQLEAIVGQPEANYESREAPQFDEDLAKRYIVKRVLDLGWTPERFGVFDEHTIGYRGREARKSERIGKKYQWIALHEIMAYTADNYHFYERYSSDEDKSTTYEGPWQPGARDIDPSNMLRTTAKTSFWYSHKPAWWAVQRQQYWGAPDKPKEWLAEWQDLPAVEKLLTVQHPETGVKWLNLEGSFNWTEPVTPDLDSTDTERRQIWYTVRAYLVKQADAPAFMQWAEADNLQSRDLPKPAQLYEVFLGEHGWSTASQYYQRAYYNGETWQKPGRDCPVEVQVFSFDYVNERGTFDCSLDETVSLNMPRAELVNSLGLRWTGIGADFIDETGQLASSDPTVHQDGPAALLVREDLIRALLIRENLSLCWVVTGEKQSIGPDSRERFLGRLNLSGAYMLSDTGAVGFLNCFMEKATRNHQDHDVLVHTIRSSDTK
ncbi:AVAST type 2 anti-phage system protein Avs2 [Hymenobacter sp. AT01-02]|uniref:AVAST type 2 anti-phage system protein Avs2 n=1 Tax=Hymenobacter sp. AT01-02 TaxID=1571877 RepID=UPI0005F0D6B4|nr:AVAST type 2 anti-phage system protein Avs2 [Hymenobacter sp. AT01-02]